MTLRLLIASAFLAPAFAWSASFAGIEVPPPPPPKPVTDTHWGVDVVDPYRFLENTGDPAVRDYLHAQAKAAYAILDRIPGRDKLLARIREIDADTPAVVGAIHRDERGGLFYLKRESGRDQFKIYYRAKADAPEVLLVDPEELAKATGKPHAVSELAPSPDGKRLAYAISPGGTEIGLLHVIDTATREDVTPPIDRVRGGEVAWLHDGSGFFYNRLAEGYEKRPRNERFMDQLTYLRILARPGEDRALFGPGLHESVAMDRSSASALFVLPGDKQVAAYVFHGVDPNHSLYLAALEDVVAGKPAWRKVFDTSALVHDIAVGNGYLYVQTARDAPRFQVLRTALPQADMARAEVVVPPGDGVVVSIAAAKEAVYMTRREGVVKHLYRLDAAAPAKLQSIALPVEGNVAIVDAGAYKPGLLVRLSGWTRAAADYRVDADAREAVTMRLVEPGRFDAPTNVVAREVMVKARDGVEVPLSILARKDVKLDGTNPTIVYGYGAYGIVQEPSWNPRTLAWLEQGGVFAIAHVRGGGIFGDAWRRAGWKATKPNTWRDGIAAGEWLVKNGYAKPARLFVYGGSAGGIFAGRSITERPDLFGAAVIAVGNTDSIRSETRANGAGNIPEYGTVTKEDEFRALQEMSPYEHVKPGTPYPAVLFEHGINDTRVDVWMSLKMAARLAAATTSGKPILLRLEEEAGHGPGATLAQAQGRTADMWAFLLWQAGVPGFQPAAR